MPTGLRSNKFIELRVAGASTATPTLFPTTASSHPRTDTCGSSMLLTRTATSRLRFASLFRRGACEIVVSAEMRSKRSSRVCVYLHRVEIIDPDGTSWALIKIKERLTRLPQDAPGGGLPALSSRPLQTTCPAGQSAGFFTVVVCCHTAIFENRGPSRGHFCFQQETR
jgi:hypothetical protein